LQAQGRFFEAALFCLGTLLESAELSGYWRIAWIFSFGFAQDRLGLRLRMMGIFYPLD
jgi:hypothetical protein